MVAQRKPELFDYDLPKSRLDHYLTKPVIAVDTETRGLQIRRDRLCLIQICDDEGVVSFVRYPDRHKIASESHANVKTLLEATDVVKLFHFGRFDITVL